MAPALGLARMGEGSFSERMKPDVLTLGREMADASANVGKHSRSAIARRHSLCLLTNGDMEAYSPTRPLAHRLGSGSERNLQASLAEKVQREAQLGISLRDVDHEPGGQSKKFKERNLDLELDLMKFELRSLKQKVTLSSPKRRMAGFRLWPEEGENNVVAVVFILPFLQAAQSSVHSSCIPCEVG